MRKGNDLRFRKVEVNDADILAEWFNDLENVKFMSSRVRGRVHTSESQRHDIVRPDDGTEFLWMVHKGNLEAPIAHAGVDDIDYHDMRGEIFFLIGDKRAKGRGIGKDIVFFLQDFAFSHLSLNSLFATATMENVPSNHILQFTGFSRIGIRREYHFLEGRYYDEVFYDITRTEYLQRFKTQL